MITVTPFKIAIPDADVADLKARLERARWPAEVAPESEERGISGAALKRLADRWQALDWRSVEADLNRHEQLMVEYEGEKLQVFHIRSPHADAIPLVLCHGWPSSGIEYLKLIEPLTNPSDGKTAFHLVIPTMPGFGLSPAPAKAGWTTKKTAAAVIELLGHLGYERFALHGTDMGSDVVSKIDVGAPGRAIGIHVGADLDSVIAVASFMGAQAADGPALDAAQRDEVKGLLAAAPSRSGYIAIQSSRSAMP